jgi:hypothetical protein
MKHTPGPWRVDGHSIKCNAQEDDTGTYVAEMLSSISVETTKANAHLIAAAPELLAACEEMEQALTNYHADIEHLLESGEEDDAEHYKAIGDILGRSLAAIQKAKGE